MAMQKTLAGAEWWPTFVVYMRNRCAIQTATVRCSFIRRWLESKRTPLEFVNTFGSPYQRLNCIAGISDFADYAAQVGPEFYGYYFPDGYTKPKLPKLPPPRDIPFIPPDDLKRMFDWIEDNYPPIFVMLAKFVYFTGLRRDELMKTQMNMLFLSATKPYLLVQRGKGGKLRRVQLMPMGVGLILHYLTIRQTILSFYGAGSEYLFIWRDGSKLTPTKIDALNKCIRAGYDFIGIDQPECPLHCLRHQFAKHLAMEYEGKPGLSIQVIQGLLGHSNIQLSERYSRVPVEHALETIGKFHPSQFWDKDKGLDQNAVEAAMRRALAEQNEQRQEAAVALEPAPEPVRYGPPGMAV